MMAAIGAGKWGFSTVPNGGRGAVWTQTVVNVGVMESHGRWWTINLNAWQGQGGFLRAANGGVGMPLGTAAGGGAGVRATIQLGGGGVDGGGSATETIIVDYPANGTVLHVHATSVNITLTGTMANVGDNTPPPLLSGWVGVGQGTNRPEVATLTEAIRVVADGAGFAESVPPRARAYRVIFLSTVQSSALQLSANATPVNLATDVLHEIPVGNFVFDRPSDRRSWYPLHPAAMQLVVSNQAGTGAVGQWSVQWLLEVG
jgi:hypothetical protein